MLKVSLPLQGLLDQTETVGIVGPVISKYSLLTALRYNNDYYLSMAGLLELVSKTEVLEQPHFIYLFKK